MVQILQHMSHKQTLPEPRHGLTHPGPCQGSFGDVNLWAHGMLLGRMVRVSGSGDFLLHYPQKTNLNEEKTTFFGLFSNKSMSTPPGKRILHCCHDMSCCEGIYEPK